MNKLLPLGFGFLASLLVLSGCAKSQTPGTQAGGTNAPATNAAAPGQNPLTAPADYLGAAAKAQKTAVRVVDTVSLNQAVQLFNVQEGRYPKDLNELVTEKYLPHIPAAPAGSKITYNPQTGEVKVVRN